MRIFLPVMAVGRGSGIGGRRGQAVLAEGFSQALAAGMEVDEALLVAGGEVELAAAARRLDPLIERHFGAAIGHRPSHVGAFWEVARGMVAEENGGGMEVDAMVDADSSGGNVGRFSGFADVYAAYRPVPPGVVVEVLAQLAEMERPGLVVDLGSGTGISSRLWYGRAEKVVGIEPNKDMRAEAERAGSEGEIVYREGYSWATGLESACADIVTCSQSLHWMEPAGTFAEVGRILRMGGVFAAMDCDWPPTIGWEVEAAYARCMARAGELEGRYGVSAGVKKWAKEGHLERMKASGVFRFCKEVVLHQVERGDAGRLVGLARSQGGVAGLLKRGVSEEEIGLTELAAAAEKWVGRGKTWYLSYRVRLGVK